MNLSSKRPVPSASNSSRAVSHHPDICRQQVRHMPCLSRSAPSILIGGRRPTEYRGRDQRIHVFEELDEVAARSSGGIDQFYKTSDKL